MSKYLDRFCKNILSANKLDQKASTLVEADVCNDTTEIYRSELVLLVSAFDAYIHEITHEYLTNYLINNDCSTKEIDNYRLPISSVRAILAEKDEDKRKDIIREKLRKENNRHSYQGTNDIEKVLALCGTPNIWGKVSMSIDVEKEYLIKKINSMVHRRNIVAHLSHSEHGIMEDMTIDEPYVCTKQFHF